MLTSGLFTGWAAAGYPMTTPVSRQLVQALFEARLSRDPARIAPFLHDDVEWSIAGPVDLMHFCGERHGKQQVINAIVEDVPSQLKVTRMDVEELLIDGDRAATFVRLSATHTGTNRNVSYRCAQFLRFRDGKLVEFRALMDSFDAAEQVLGHAINTSLDAPTDLAANGDRIAI
jgi:ketosteroid isomerase-like protein